MRAAWPWLPKELNSFMDQNDRARYLVDTYADTILRLSCAYLKNTADTQDICQTVFVKLLTAPREFESPEHEKAQSTQILKTCNIMTITQKNQSYCAKSNGSSIFM